MSSIVIVYLYIFIISNFLSYKYVHNFNANCPEGFVGNNCEIGMIKLFNRINILS